MANPTLSYSKVWRWISIDWSLFYNFSGKDFNPTVPDFPDSWETVTAYSPVASFDLSGYQPWHEIWCYVRNITTDNVSWDLEVYSMLQASWNGGWHKVWDYTWNYYTTKQLYAWYMYFWVDYDEIWDYATNYRISTTWSLDNYWNSGTPDYVYFTVSNLDIDSTRHTSWYLWVEWNNLCYTDASYSHNSWYKHKIAYDSWYSTYVWTNKAWHIRLRPWDNSRICYVDENWYSRRTYPADPRYWWNVNVWSSRAWYMWVSDGQSQEDWYAHLCFIAPNWNKMRILNWPTRWYN